MTSHRIHHVSATPAPVVPLVPHAGTHSAPSDAGSESFITELTTAVGHLEKALELGRTTTRFRLPNGATVTTAQLCLWVAQQTARAQNLLDQISAPYTDPQT